MNSSFLHQAGLLLRVLPVVNKFPVFALKGGTAINFFVRNLPRLSVDIDLAFLPLMERNEALNSISSCLQDIEYTVQRIIPGLKCQKKYLPGTKTVSSLIVSWNNAIVKIEPNTTIRGSVYPPVNMQLCKKAEELFEVSFEIQSLVAEELYAGKICAALDRQHPRDLFDVKLLYDNEGVSDKLIKAFIIYLISHNRPIEEVLNPNFLDIESVYRKEFIGMTDQEVDLITLTETRIRLINDIKSALTLSEKQFLISFKNKNPDWALPGIENADKLPAVRWKLKNLGKMQNSKHSFALKKLEDYLMS